MQTRKRTMTQKVVELTDVEGKTLIEMADASLPVSPRLFFYGRDRDGAERNGVIILDDFLTLPSQKARYEYMVDTGKLAARTEPYFHELLEIR